MTIRVLIAAALAAAAGGVRAEETPASILVSASRVEQQRLSSVGGSSVSHEELTAYGEVTLADALRRVPGVTVQGGDIRLHGMGNGRTLILLDGEPVPAGFSLDSLAPDLVERIDVQRAATAESGAQAIAGSINIVLRKTGRKARRTLKAGALRNANDMTPTAAIDWSDGRFSLAGTAQQSFTTTRSNENEEAPGLLRVTARSERAERRALTLAPRWNLANGLTLNAFLRGYALDARVGAQELDLMGDASQYPRFASENHIYVWNLRSDIDWSTRFDDGARLELKAGVTGLHRHSGFQFHGSGAVDGLHVVHGAVAEEGWTSEGKFRRDALVLGWDLARNRRRESRIEHLQDGTQSAGSDEHFAARVDRSALFAQWEADVDAWTLAPGLRLERGWSPMLHAVRRFGQANQLRLALTRTYRAPPLSSLVARRYTVDNDNGPNNPDSQGNPALRPERAWGWDATFEHMVGKTGLVSANFYLRRIDGTIQDALFQLGGAWVTMPVNAGKSEQRGVELEARIPLEHVDLHAGVTRNWTDLRSEGQAPWTATTGVDVRAAALPLTWSTTLVLKGGLSARSSPLSTVAEGAVRLLDVSAAWRFAGGWRVRVAASDLLHLDAVRCARFADGSVRRVAASAGVSLRVLAEFDLP